MTWKPVLQGLEDPRNLPRNFESLQRYLGSGDDSVESRLGAISVGAFDVTDDAGLPNGADVWGNWSGTIPNPGRAVALRADFTGRLRNTSGGGVGAVNAQVGVSDDDGSTWAAADNANFPGVNVAAASIPRAAIACGAFYTGTPSDDIKLRVATFGTSISGAMEALDGLILWTMVPA